jgi:hypothetical protein
MMNPPAYCTAVLFTVVKSFQVRASDVKFAVKQARKLPKTFFIVEKRLGQRQE